MHRVPYDLDGLIEVRAGKNVADVIRQEGESYFRKLERKVLHGIFDLGDRIVVACGGGTPCFFDNLEHMLQRGTVVYLRMDPALLAERLRDGTEQRPLLHGVDTDGLEAHIVRHLAEREPYYRQAHIIWEASDGNMDNLAAEILRQSR